MGYRVGMQCFSSEEAAYDYVLSQLPPTITNDGQIIRPVKSNQGWELNGQAVHLSFPECDPVEQIQLGIVLAAPFIGLCILVWGINMIKKLIVSMNVVDERDD